MAKFAVLVLSLVQLLLLFKLAPAKCNKRETTLATFNAAMVPGTLGAVDVRTGVLIDQMQKSDVDIFCLQEVWQASVQRKIRNDLKAFYPYALSAIDLSGPGSDTPACDSDALDALFACRELRCPGLSGPQLAFCGTLRCVEEFSQLARPCILCLLYDFIVDNETRCRTAPAGNYERTFGLMILSKKELKNTTVIPQNDQSQLRGILTASVDDVGDLVCTHLTTAVLQPPLYAGPPVVFPFRYSSYFEQHRDEVMKILDIIHTMKMKVPILMGDFNHGPASPGGIEWQFPFYYGLMNARGFVSPYVLKDGRCTFCVDNPFTVISAAELVDHIYITTDTTERVIFAERFFDDVILSIGVPISDHYGVKVRLSNIRKNCNSVQKCRYHCVSEIKEFIPSQPNYSEVCFS